MSEFEIHKVADSVLGEESVLNLCQPDTVGREREKADNERGEDIFKVLLDIQLIANIPARNGALRTVIAVMTMFILGHSMTDRCVKRRRES